MKPIQKARRYVKERPNTFAGYADHQIAGVVEAYIAGHRTGVRTEQKAKLKQEKLRLFNEVVKQCREAALILKQQPPPIPEVISRLAFELRNAAAALRNSAE